MRYAITFRALKTKDSLIEVKKGILPPMSATTVVTKTLLNGREDRNESRCGVVVYK